ncbi:MAG TPA: MarR family winged helix-turn-helix transcriptional regulator [Isosphaeraceae bacterium]|jgi:DNA-binding MarR family transcriptional regulator|nr:MarR family winged helix-turn-helix transcriptional regulator [Isosphaeraceae bacterium]
MSFARKSERLSLPVLNDDPRGWDVRVVTSLVRFNSRLERRMAEALAVHGLTVAQFDVLATLGCGDGITQQELAEWLLVTKGNIVGLIDRVSAAGWVERRPDPEDRRVNRLYLTDAAWKLMAKVEPGQVALVKDIFGKLTEEELRQMHALLQRLDGACTESG